MARMCTLLARLVCVAGTALFVAGTFARSSTGFVADTRLAVQIPCQALYFTRSGTDFVAGAALSED